MDIENVDDEIIKPAKEWTAGLAFAITAKRLGVKYSDICHLMAGRYNGRGGKEALFTVVGSETKTNGHGTWETSLLKLNRFKSLQELQERVYAADSARDLDLAYWAAKMCITEDFGSHPFYVLAGGEMADEMYRWLCEIGKGQKDLKTFISRGWNCLFSFLSHKWPTPEIVRKHDLDIRTLQLTFSPLDWPFLTESDFEEYRELARRGYLKGVNYEQYRYA